MAFKDQFVNTPPGPAREELVYQAAIKQGRPKTVPLAIEQPNGDKYIYQVMPDFLMIDGLRVPMTGPTAERIAKYFGMSLPTAKMNQQIYDAAKQRGGALVAKPMSGRTTTYEGKTYTPESVVGDVSKSELTPAFNALIESDPNYQKNKDGLVAGHMKSIVAPDPNSPSNRLWLHGLYDKDGKPIQGGSGLTPHDLSHAEYASGARFVSDTFTVEHKDGTTEAGVAKNKGSYLTGPHAPTSPVASSAHRPGPPPGTTGVTEMPPDIRPQAESLGKELLNQPMWTEKSVNLGGTQYIVKVEPHSNAPKGVSFYKVVNQQAAKPTETQVATAPKTQQYTPPTSSPAQARMSILERINKLLDNIGRG